MTLAQLKAEVCAYVNRTADDLEVNGVDLVVQAANNSKKKAQRILDFELCRMSLRVTVPAGLSADITNGTFIDEFSNQTNYRINRIERAFILQETAYGAETGSGGLRPIDYRLRNEVAKREQRFYDDHIALAIVQNTEAPIPNSSFTVLVRHGDRAYLWPKKGEDTTVVLDCLVWVPDYSGDTEAITIVSYVAGFGPLPGGTPEGYPCVFYSRGIYNNSPFYVFDDPDNPAYLFYVGEADAWVIAPKLSDVTTDNYLLLTSHGRPALKGNFDWEPHFTYSGEWVSPQITSVMRYAQGPQDDFFMEECYDWVKLDVMRSMNYLLKHDDRTAVTQKQVDEAWGGVVAWNSSIADSGGGQEYDLD